MAETSGAHAAPVEDEDSDWEYEYHETETESFYVTLDLSSANQHIRTKTKKKSTAPKSPQGDSIATPAKTNLNGAVDSPEPTVQDGEDKQDGDDLVMSNPNGEQSKVEEPEDRIQILDLHSSNPIVSYQDQIYSCEWTTTIGTDILLSVPDPDFLHPVLKEEEGISIIAATGIKLFGRPANLASRPSASAANERNKSIISVPGNSTAIANTTVSFEKPTQIKIPAGSATKGREKQAKFLERLIAIKAAKDEKDEVTTASQRPSEVARLRNKAEAKAKAKEEQHASKTPDGDVVGYGSVPVTPDARGSGTANRSRRGRSRRPGPRTKEGGLFRDYRPSPSDPEGADIRNGGSSTATPDSWAQLPHLITSNTTTNNNLANISFIKTPPPPPPPQASPLKTAPVVSPHSHTHSAPLPLLHPYPTQNPTQDQSNSLPSLSPALAPNTTPPSTASANASADAATGRGAAAPSPIDAAEAVIPEMRSVRGGGGERSGSDGGADVDAGVGSGAHHGDDGGGGGGGMSEIVGDGDVEMEDV